MFCWTQRPAEDQTSADDIHPQPAPTANLIIHAESRDACFPFEVHLLVHYWTATGVNVPDPFLIAQAGIGRRVRAVTRLYPVTEGLRVRRELEVALSSGASVNSTGVTTSASCLGVYAQTEYLEKIRRRDELRRRQTTRVWEREAEEAEVTYLGRMIDDPARATAWWFRQNPEAIRQLPEIAQIFQKLRADLTADGTDDRVSGDNWDEIFAEFHRRADPAARHLLTHQISQIFTDHKLGDLADRARLLDGNPSVE